MGGDPQNAHKEYPTLVEEYSKQKRPDLNEAHHNEMVRIFVSQMSDALKTYGDSKGITFSSNLEKEVFYGDIAWAGLYETKAFKAMSIENQNRIKDTVSGEQSGTDRLGNTKAAKGSLGGCQ